jgi:hypothetical protein
MTSATIRTHRDTAIVLAVGDRFFAGTTKTGRLSIAWSVAGAMLFGPWREAEITAAEARLKKRGYPLQRRTIALQPTTTEA